jgi:hypothetical protein
VEHAIQAQRELDQHYVTEYTFRLSTHSQVAGYAELRRKYINLSGEKYVLAHMHDATHVIRKHHNESHSIGGPETCSLPFSLLAVHHQSNYTCVDWKLLQQPPGKEFLE